MNVVRCDGCGADIGEAEGLEVTGHGDDRPVLLGPVDVASGKQFDFCPSCTTVALTAVAMHRDLIHALRKRKVASNGVLLRMLQEYVMDPLTQEQAHHLDAMPQEQQSAALARRYRPPTGVLVAHTAMLILTRPS